MCCLRARSDAKDWQEARCEKRCELLVEQQLNRLYVLIPVPPCAEAKATVACALRASVLDVGTKSAAAYLLWLARSRNAPQVCIHRLVGKHV